MRNLIKSYHRLLANILFCLLIISACGDESSTTDSGTSDNRTVGDSGSSGKDATEAPTEASVHDSNPTGQDAKQDADAKVEDIDLTLGGFNQDLPPPSEACERKENEQFACLSVSGEYNGEPIDSTGYAKSVLWYPNDTRSISREIELGPDDSLSVMIVLGPSLIPVMTVPHTTIPAPSVFYLESPPYTVSHIYLSRSARQLESHDDGIIALTESHEVKMRIAGELWFAEIDESRMREMVYGTFAISAIPKSDCLADADGYGCDEIRLRGSFGGGTLFVISIKPAT